MNQFWSAMAQNAAPYTPGEQPRDLQYIKLNTNECPYPGSVWLNQISFSNQGMQLYPDPNAANLRSLIATRYGLESSEVFVGNGSDEVLAFSFMAFTSQKQPISFANITYSFYAVYAQLFQVPQHVVPLREGFVLDLDDYENGSGPVILANPNAPTGLAVPVARLERFLQAHPDRLLIVDEAYVDFGSESMVPYIHSYPNLLVIQTFSKSRALAGARVGFAMGSAELIQALDRIKNSFNSYTISTLSQKMAAFSILDEDYFQWTCQQIMSTREKTQAALRRLGFESTDSKGNFLWLRHPKIGGKELYWQLRQRGILVRHFDGEIVSDYIRVSIGTVQDMETFVKAMHAMVEEAGGSNE